MMMAPKLLVALFVGQAMCFNMEVSMKSSLTFDEAAAKNRPVSKVTSAELGLATSAGRIQATRAWGSAAGEALLNLEKLGRQINPPSQ